MGGNGSYGTGKSQNSKAGIAALESDFGIFQFHSHLLATKSNLVINTTP